MRPRICLTLLSLLVGVSVEAKPYKNYSPAWSPDGQELAFYSDRDGNWEIYLVAADGSNLRRLTFDPSDDTQPSYSPDGSSILFSSDREGDFDVYLMPRAGGPARNLTQAPSAESAPTFSPDGHSIAFMSDRGGSEQIYLMAADGSGVERLTKVVEEIGRPAWSPDGRRIAFFGRYDSRRALHVIDLDRGSDVLDLQLGWGGNPSWSPDGRRILFDDHADRIPASGDGRWELWSVATDGSHLERLTDNDVDDWGGKYSPDGARIAFAGGGRQNTGYEIYVADSDGPALERLTFGNLAPLAPGRPVAFVGASLVPMDRDGVIEDQVLLVRDGRISAIGDRGAIAIPEEALRIEAEGKYLVPGLIDSHVHLDDDTGLGVYLAHGVTTVRQMHGTPEHLKRRAAVNAGTKLGPTVYSAGPSIVSVSPEYEFNVATPEQARERVRWIKAQGADWVKTVGLDRPIFEALLEEAQLQGIPVGGHVPSLEWPFEEIYSSGMRSHEHIKEVYTGGGGGQPRLRGGPGHGAGAAGEGESCLGVDADLSRDRLQRLPRSWPVGAVSAATREGTAVSGRGRYRERPEVRGRLREDE